MAKKVSKKKTVRQPKPMKIAALIVSAIQDLKETKGSTPRKITGYITYASQLPVRKIKRQVNSALKRGVQYGILRRYRGHYYLPSGDELERANKIACRFAKLPSPDPDESIPDIPYPGPIKEASSKLQLRRLGRESYSTKFREPKRCNLNNKKPKKSLSVPESTSLSLTNRFQITDDELSFDSNDD